MKQKYQTINQNKWKINLPVRDYQTTSGWRVNKYSFGYMNSVQSNIFLIKNVAICVTNAGFGLTWFYFPNH